MSNLIILHGASGCGKTTIENRLIKEWLVRPIEVITNRQKRDDDPKHYRFVKTEDFEKIAAKESFDFFFHTEMNDKWYGYKLPFEYGNYIVSFIHDLNAIHFANLANKYGFTIHMITINYDIREVVDIIDNRDGSIEEKENRKSLIKKDFAEELIHKDVHFYKEERDNVYDLIRSILRPSFVFN